MYTDRTYFTNKEQNLLKQKRALLTHKSKISTFSIRLTGALLKSQVVVPYNSPDIILLLIRWKILLILRYAFVDREVHKSLNYQPKFSQMERPLVNVF